MNPSRLAMFLPLVALPFLADCSREAGTTQRLPGEPVPLADMIRIRADTYIRIRYPVTVTRDFWIGKYEVTQAEYYSLMGRNPSYFTNDLQHPVEKVTWLQAHAYCGALTKRERLAKRLPEDYEYRLPTEAEWELACRAGTTNFYSFGDAVDEAEQYAWTLENSGGTSHPVGQKRPNAFGLHDMHGNVWEWCSDSFAPYPAMPLTNPVGPVSSPYKVFRGGGWNQPIELARSRNRFMMSPTNGIHFVGFRIALGAALDR